MTSTDQELTYQEVKPAGQSPLPAAAVGADWGNSAPLALAAFAVTTFMLSMINSGLMNAGITPVVFGVALMFGGLTQLISGVLQFRTGNTFGGVPFSTLAASCLSVAARAEFAFKEVTCSKT